MAPGTTMSMEWEPHTAGRWIFHCHMVAHMSDHTNLNLHPLDGSEPAPDPAQVADAAGLGGLVIGVTVLPATATTETEAAAPPALPVRQLRLAVEPRPASSYLTAGFGFRIQEGSSEPSAPPSGAPPVPGAPLVLTRGEPVEITVVNQLSEATAVHWHGIELESYYDGVPGWGGRDKQVTPPIPPGGSWVVRFTPPRAGTFI
jgi:FtsP/CotA-like multicopper oxidase with cupredoxin domain